MKRFKMLFLMMLPLWIFAANFSDLPTEVVQPDGSTLSLLASGDEYANRLHDADGYSIIQSPTDGYYYFAILSGDEPVASSWRADSHDPRILGLTPGISISPTRYREKVQQMTPPTRNEHRAPNTGTVNNVVVYIRFSDQTEFTDTRATYDARFNATGDDTYSLRNYFHKVSYDQLDYVSHHYPTCAPEINLSYQDSHPRAYFMPYNAITNPQGYQDYQRTEREHQLLADAIEAIAPQVPTDLNIDADNDSYVDNVCFIIRGPHTAWAELLWAHRWALYTVDTQIHSKMVWDFTFQPENQNSVRTLCHEMFHSVGAPDLYHYEFDGLTPAGCWDIMESGYGHMGMYMKYKYGDWIDPIPVITPGTHFLSPVTSQYNNAYKIPISGSQFLVLEYRKQGSDIFEASLPGSGLLIYRIDEDNGGNSQGPPDEVYVYRPEGTISVNGLIAEAAFSQTNYRTEFNQYTNPSSFTVNGTPFSININGIYEDAESISFTYSAQGPFPPVVESLSPANAAIITSGPFTAVANVTAPLSSVTSVEFFFNGVLMGIDYEQPYSVLIPLEAQSLGYSEIRVTALSAGGMQTSAITRFRIVDPLENTWFTWMTPEPVWDEYGRGAVPIKAAIDYDLGAQDYVVRKLAFHAVADTWGLPDNPGLVNAKIYRFNNGAITNQVLLNIGDLTHPMNGRQEYIIDSTVPISGQIAVVLDLYEYQNILFDTAAPCGHSWFTEPDRPWTDALGRGMLGAAAIELQLQAPNVACNDPVAPELISGLTTYPNPFRESSSIAFSLKEAQHVCVSIYNLKGQRVRELIDSSLLSGKHEITWDGCDTSTRKVSTGLYIYKLQAGKEVITGRLALIH